MAGSRPSRSSARVPVRTCVGCRERTDKSHLIRVVAGGEQPSALRLDLRGGLPGRGAHLHLDLACLDSAERRRAFGRALRLAEPVDTAEVRQHLERLARSAPREQDEPEEQ